MVTTAVLGNQSLIYALKTDIKPIKDITNGTPLLEIDEDEGISVYIFDGENKKWIKV